MAGVPRYEDLVVDDADDYDVDDEAWVAVGAPLDGPTRSLGSQECGPLQLNFSQATLTCSQEQDPKAGTLAAATPASLAFNSQQDAPLTQPVPTGATPHQLFEPSTYDLDTLAEGTEAPQSGAVPGLSPADPKPSDFLTVVGTSGRICYLGCEPPPSDDVAEEDGRVAFAPGSLLGGMTVTELSEACQERAARRAAAAAAEVEAAVHAAPQRVQTQLLVDKYRPTGYLDLTSNEDVNLSVLEWFKSWDAVVFPKRGAKAGETGGPAAAKKRRVEQKEDLRPEEKILLISGPPGAGKTTLATVIAKHCGYDAHQINASMDRTASSLDDRINASVAGGTTLSGKPSCLILDEVDGIAHSSAPGGGVLAHLLKLSTTPFKERSSKKPIQIRPVICICNNPWEKELRQLREVAHHIKVDSVLPVKLVERLLEICANEGVNADTACLRELCTLAGGDIRSCLFTLQFLSQKYRGKRLTQRQISGVGLKDRVYSYFDTMEAIFHGDDNRAAHVLRKVENGSGGGASGGGAAPRVSTGGGGGGGVGVSKPQAGASAQLIRHMSSGHPDMERILDGCFEEYLNTRYPDYDLSRTKGLMRAASGFDVFDAAAKEKMFFGVDYMYAPQLLVTYHRTCQTARMSRKHWGIPKASQEHRRKLQKADEIIQSFFAKNEVRKQYFTTKALVLDYLTPYVAILNPTALRVQRPAALAAFQTNQDPAEQAAFDRVVQQYAADGLGLKEVDVPDKTPGTPFGSMRKAVKMDPNLDALIFYGKSHRRFYTLRDDVRRRLWTAVKNVRIAQEAQSVDDPSAAAKSTAGGKKTPWMFGGGRLPAEKGAPQQQQQQQPAVAKPQQLPQPAVAQKPGQKLSKPQPPSALKGLSKVAAGVPGGRKRVAKRDMFGNLLKQKAPAADGPGNPNPLAAHRMFDPAVGCKYDQNRGFTNAVRKQGSWEDWL